MILINVDFFIFLFTMKLAEYISELLYRYDCVIVPDFGGFITKNKSASIGKDNTFYPPVKELSFNSHLKFNDGLLANYIASVDKMPFDSAVNFIKFEVSQWKEQLQNTDLFIDNIGSFSLFKDKITFEPETKVNYLTDSYGLTTVISTEVKRETYKKQVEKLEEKAPILITEQAKKKPNYLKYAAILILGLGLLGAGGFAYRNYEQQKEVAAAKKQQKVIEDKIQQATFIVADPLPSIFVDATRASYPYHVVAGAFRFPENAEKMVTILKEKGYENARILGVNQWGLTQVSFNSYSDRNEATNALYKARQDANSDAWLLVQDL